MSHPAIDHVKLVYLDDPDEVHELVVSTAAAIQGGRFETENRINPRSIDFAMRGAAMGYLAAKRVGLPGTSDPLTMDSLLAWADEVAFVGDDEPDTGVDPSAEGEVPDSPPSSS